MDQTAVATAVHHSPARLVLAVTGGGSGLISTLLTTPGASNTVLECVVPYAAESLHEWLGIVPDSNCSEDTALQMAAVAHRRAVHLIERSKAGDNVQRDAILGVGLTAALATNRERKGDERAYLAMHSFGETRLTSFQFQKGAMSRKDQESRLTELCLAMLALACGVKLSPLCDERAWDHVESASSTISPPAAVVRDVIEGHRPWAVRVDDRNWSTEFETRPVGLLSGSFHPLHAAHLQLADLATDILRGPVAFELPMTNADKPPVDYFSLLKRMKNFGDRCLVVTAAPTFVEKSQLFPGTTFVVGADTAARICDRRFYNNSPEEMHQALTEIAARGCSFLVAARRVKGQVTRVDDLSIPEVHRPLFRGIPVERFLWDLSSTEIRKGRAE